MGEFIESITDNDEGYTVKTTDQTITLFISMDQDCCERTGYFMSEDDTSSFVGAELLGVEIVDEALNKQTAPDIYEGSVMFVNLNTSRGVLQFVAYNEHNGYYGHDARVLSKQLTHSEVL